MAAPNDNISMALYCDFENVALGVRDANYDRFDIKPVLERLLLKGSIVVKKAYCDWDRYKEFKGKMHEASFELIEIPHVRVSGKNSADIRMVVDALDLCYTKAHVNTFVIISGDSDFSPLVSKLRENAKYVIGVGVKNSTSDLLVANCDEFIFIDDLVRESRRTAASREKRAPTPRRQSEVAGEERKPKEDLETRKSMAIEIVAETFDALMTERGDGGKIWASALKQAIKRRRPDFNEVYFGFRTFGNLLEEAQQRGLLDIGRDDKSGAFVYRNHRNGAVEDTAAVPAAVEIALLTQTPATPEMAPTAHTSHSAQTAETQQADEAETAPAGEQNAEPASTAQNGNGNGNGNAVQPDAEQQAPRRNGRYPRNNRGSRFPDTAAVSAPPLRANVQSQPAAALAVAAEDEHQPEPVKPVQAASDDDYDPLQAELDAADAAALIASGMLAGHGKNRPQPNARSAKQGGKPGKTQVARASGRPDPRRPPVQDRFASPRPAPSGRPGQPPRRPASGPAPAQARNDMPSGAQAENNLPASANVEVMAAPEPRASAPAPEIQASSPAPVPSSNGAAPAQASLPMETTQADAAPKRRPRGSAKKTASADAETQSPAALDSEEAAKPARKPRRPAAKKAVADEA
ncbi:MAG: NYN domain-containing protein [Janthinobacterium lividum]